MKISLQFGIRRVIVHEGADIRMKRQAGFSLVELAVAVFIIGLIASMSFGTIKAQLINASIRTTQGNQDTIKSALISYLGQHRRLPCPDTDVAAPDGLENSPCVTPATSFGLLPYKTLGLSKTAALDGWDNFFAYQVSNTTPTIAIPNQDWTITSNFHEGNTGVITIKDGSPTPMLNIVAVILSYGKDGLGARTIKGTRNTLPDQTTQPDEYQNAVPTTPPNVFYKREYSDNTTVTGGTGGTFDDVVMILSANDLLVPLIKDGVMQSALSAYAIQVSKIQDWVASYITSSTATPSCDVPGVTGNSSTTRNMPTSLTVDPWGNTLNAPGSPFTYCQGAVIAAVCTVAVPSYNSSSGSAAFTLLNTSVTSPSNQVIAPTGARMGILYPFLNFTNSRC